MTDVSRSEVGAYDPRAAFRGKLSCEKRWKSLGQTIVGMINKGNMTKTASKD